MSATLYDPSDLKELAVTGAEFDEALSLAKLPRLVEALVVPQPESSKAACKIRLDCDPAGWPRLSGTLSATLQAQCQRCLEPVCQVVETGLHWNFGGDDSVAGGTETLDIGAGRVSIASLLEDELLLQLPQIVRHRDERDCGPLVQRLHENEEPVPNRPFEALAALKGKLGGNDS